jgi:proteasome lid subunit RPN8/RPN11
MITLRPEHLDAIRRHGEADYPYECCGLLIGLYDESGNKTVEEIYPISNAREETAKRNRFLITPAELLYGEKHARWQKRDVVGFYHSHPDHPAKPSEFDLEHAWPTYSYVIVSVCQSRAGELFSWELEADRSKFKLEELTIRRMTMPAILFGS